MVEFIASNFAVPVPKPLKIASRHVAVMQGMQRNEQKKRDSRAELLFCFFDIPFAVAVVVL